MCVCIYVYLSKIVNSLSQDISSTIEHLQELLLTSNKEKERLARENEAMKKEIERLKRQQHAV